MVGNNLVHTFRKSLIKPNKKHAFTNYIFLIKKVKNIKYNKIYKKTLKNTYYFRGDNSGQHFYVLILIQMNNICFFMFEID